MEQCKLYRYRVMGAGGLEVQHAGFSLFFNLHSSLTCEILDRFSVKLFLYPEKE